MRKGGWGDKASGFGVRLRELRAAAGHTQKELAGLAGCSLNTVARVERGEHEPAWPLVLLLARALGVGVEAFVAEGEASPVPAGRGRPRKETKQ